MKYKRVPTKYKQMKKDGKSEVDIFVEIHRDRDGASVQRIMSALFDLDIASNEMKQIAEKAYQVIFHDFIELKNKGYTATELAKEARKQGITGLNRMNMISFVFGYNLLETKEAIVIGDGVAKSLDEYQGQIAKMLEQDILENCIEEDDI